MSEFELRLRRVTRRDSIKGALLAPLTAVAATRWLSGCSSDTPGAASPEQTAAPSQPAVAGGSGSAAGGAPSAAAAGANASAGSGGAGAAGSAGRVAGAGSSAAGTSGISSTAGAGAAAGATAPSANAGMSAPAPTAGSSGAIAPVAGSSGAIAGSGVAWAAGGTRSMQGPYPDPFAMGMGGTACSLYPAQTLGPCYANGPAVREDISDGAKGLPTRLSFLVVAADGCTPIPNATVDVWHSGFDGVYSAFGSGVCNPNALDVADQMFCRGVQRTNEHGRVDFSTIFPGWYSSRSVHIHFTVRASGMGEATSQLYFEDDLTTEIQAQGEYKARGMRNTTNASDFIFRSGGASPAEVIMSTAKRPDGSLHAWKVLAIG